MSYTLKRLPLAEREIILVGTAHISQESIAEVQQAIASDEPDAVCIELDEQRLKALQDTESWRKLDIVQVLKSGQGFLLMANLALSSFQKRMGSEVAVPPGSEMIAALQAADERNIPVALVDRPIQTTLRRAWARNSLWGKAKLLSALISSAFDNETVSAEEIEKLKEQSAMDSMMAELSEYLPKVKEVLIDERDFYLAAHIWQTAGKKVLAVLGAAHLAGVQAHLERLAAGECAADTSAIESVPPASLASKVAGWAFPAMLIGLIVAGFFKGGLAVSLDMLVRWLLWNGSLAALGSLVALAHPLAIVAGFVGAPIATLNPFIGVGMFTGLVQAWVRKPKVEDMEYLMRDITSLKGIYHNRISRVLLVFFLSSIGGVIGNIISVPDLVRVLAK